MNLIDGFTINLMVVSSFDYQVHDEYDGYYEVDSYTIITFDSKP